MEKKRIISLLLSICMLFTLAVCGETNEDSLLSNSDELIDEPIADSGVRNLDVKGCFQY